MAAPQHNTPPHPRRLGWILGSGISLGLATGLGLYYHWVEQQTADVFVAGDWSHLALEKIRWAHASPEARDRQTCFGAHSRMDILRGHSRAFCKPYEAEIRRLAEQETSQSSGMSTPLSGRAAQLGAP